MKLLRYGPSGEEQPGILDPEGGIRSLAGIVHDIADTVLSAEGLARLRALDLCSLPRIHDAVRLGPCVGVVSKVVGVAQNYHDFISYAGLPMPKHPILFIKPPSSICGPADDILLQVHDEKADWEMELGVVIGSIARSVSVEEAMGRVAGYCALNDITERGRVAQSGQFVNGKSADTYTPVGPYLVTTDEIADHKNLGIYFDLNGQRYQSGNTASMIFGVEFLISHISELMTLLPGDIIATGTPMGVGARATPARYLRAGDQLCGSIDHLGSQTSRVIART